MLLLVFGGRLPPPASLKVTVDPAGLGATFIVLVMFIFAEYGKSLLALLIPVSCAKRWAQQLRCARLASWRGHARGTCGRAVVPDQLCLDVLEIFWFRVVLLDVVGSLVAR